MTNRIDRYARGDLAPQEARELAQASLDSPELFDELTGVALAKAALNPRTVRAARVIRIRRRTAVIAGGLAAAAAGLVLISLPHRPSISKPNLKAVLEPAGNAGQPVLLANGLHPAEAPVFRGGEPDSRAPQAAGAIVSIEDGSANINLGSLDGLAKGAELQVFRGSGAAGRLQVTTVFRDRARASVIEGKPRPKDEVHVGGADHLNALLQQVDAAYNRGDSDTAIQLAGEAVHWGESAAGSPGAMAEAWNQLAVLRMLRGEYSSAGPVLMRAASAASQTDPVYSRIQNNLGVLAELRGEPDKAAASYRDALGASSGDQRLTVERNLARVRGLR